MYTCDRIFFASVEGGAADENTVILLWRPYVFISHKFSREGVSTTPKLQETHTTYGVVIHPVGIGLERATTGGKHRHPQNETVGKF